MVKKKIAPIEVEEIDEAVEDEVQETVVVDEEETTDVDVASMRSEIYSTMGMKVFQPDTRYHLKTHWPELDRTLGSERGLPYGKIIELSGMESHGKSLIQKLIYGEAQKDGAVVIHGDIEDSDDPKWNVRLGVDNNSLIVIKPKMVFVPLDPKLKAANAEAKAEWKAKPVQWRKLHPFVLPYESTEKRAQTAEEIFEEMHWWIKKLSSKGVEKFVLGIDSIANLSTKKQLNAGMHQNMNTNVDVATFLAGALKQWQIICANYNVLMIPLNQIREKPGVMFGDPQYEPCGRALRHNAHSRNRVRRKGNGKKYQQGKLIGINSIILNKKNKTGEDSEEGRGCEMNLNWASNKPLYERVSFTRFVKKAKEEKEE